MPQDSDCRIRSPTRKVLPKGNLGRTIGADGGLSGAIDLAFATVYTYYAVGAAAQPPAVCGGGSANQAGQLKSAVPHGIAATTFVYDAAGRLVASSNGRGTTCRGYDAEGRLTSARAPGEAQATIYSYDPAGQVRSATDGSGTVSTSYDEAGRVVDLVDSFGAEMRLSYDADGNVVQRAAATGSLATSTNYTTSYAYDAAGQLIGLDDPRGAPAGHWSFFYDSRGDLKATQYPNGTYSWADVDPLGRLTGLDNRHGTLPSPLPAAVPADASPIVDFAYSYNQDGQKTEKVRSGGGLAAETTSYGYDGVGRLSQVTLPDGTVRSYGFDADSNRTAIVENGATVATYAYDPGVTAGTDQLTTVTQAGTTASYGYTADGQVSRRGSDTLAWDGRGRLAGGSFGATTLAYTYDAAGGLRTRTAGTAQTSYLLGGLFETDTTGAVTASLAGGPAGGLARFAGPPVSGSPVSYLYYNGHGDLAAETDPSGTQTALHDYDPFGAPLDPPPTNQTSHRYLGAFGKHYDSTPNLILMGARPYDPTLGRFLSVDPIDGGSLNNYDYTAQDPINNYDLNGTMWADVGAAGQPGCTANWCPETVHSLPDVPLASVGEIAKGTIETFGTAAALAFAPYGVVGAVEIGAAIATSTELRISASVSLRTSPTAPSAIATAWKNAWTAYGNTQGAGNDLARVGISVAVVSAKQIADNAWVVRFTIHVAWKAWRGR